MTEDSLDRMAHDSVTAWARDHVVASNATMIVAGKFDPALVKHHIAYNADHVKAGTSSAAITERPISKVSWIRGIDTIKSPTLSIDIRFQAGIGMDASYAKRLVLAQVIDSRLSKLRGKQAVTYGISADYIPRRAGGMWSISGEVDATRAGEAAKQIMAILDGLRSDPESYRADFVVARQKVIESILLMGTSSHAVVERLVEAARFDLADDFYDQAARTVAQLTIASFHPFVEAELARNKLVFGAYGNDAAVTDAIKAAQAERLMDSPF
jgi:predicted Zn-dependent peptidase